MLVSPKEHLMQLKQIYVGTLWLAALAYSINGMPQTIAAPAAKPSAKPPAKPTAKPTPTATPVPFVAVKHDVGFVLPEIVLQYDPVAKTGYDWEKLGNLNFYQLMIPDAPVVHAVRYLREAVQRMTGKDLPVVSRNDLRRGIVITTLKAAPPELQKDPEVIQALRDNGKDSYNANEAFFIRTEPQRIVVITNTIEGFGSAVVELVESVGYEALGMGPNWTHVPDYTAKPLTFALRRAGRAGFYVRQFGAASGQPGGIGTLFLKPLPDPADETVEISYQRWLTGARMASQSMPHFPGHAMQAYHKAVIEKMRETGSAAGFLSKTSLGTDAERTPATGGPFGPLWINTDAPGQPAAGKAFFWDGKAWQPAAPTHLPASLDFSAPLVRDIILADMKKKAQTHFEAKPDALFVFGTDPEDGTGFAEIGKRLHNRNWYPEYLEKEGVKFGQPYVLHGFKGLNQPREIWDANAPADTVFGFNNWLLREFDKWLDSLPAAERVTSTGKSKKELVRASLYSYNYHDVPANFNLDPRIRLMIAGYPKHRGDGKWKKFASQLDVAQAFQKQLPREPSGDYWILSLAAYHDGRTEQIGNSSKLPATLQKRISDMYQAGFRAINAEVDFNHGRLGLDYYMYSKLMWNPHLTVAELDALRTRWIQRAFGSGWREMKEYYDFIAPQNLTVNAPNNWAKAIRMIEAADKKLAGTVETAALRRIDDLKQFWYFYYLIDSGQAKSNLPAMREYLWKGQMSYMHAMHAVATNYFKNTNVREVVGPELSAGPAHYTRAETHAWWTKILEHWQVTPVTDFADAILANGARGRTVDQKDLVAVREFGSESNVDNYFYYPGDEYTGEFLTAATQAGEEVGFKLSWPYKPDEFRYSPKDVAYGIARYNPQTKQWDDLVDITMTNKASAVVEGKAGAKWNVVEVRYKAPAAGTYRFDIGRAGNLARLASLDQDIATDTVKGTRPFSYSALGIGYTQSAAYIYIPKGTKTLDLEVWNATNIKKLQLHTGLPATGLKPTRLLDVGKQGTHKVALNPGEDGSIAYFYGDIFNFPQLYSVPVVWAKSPGALLVPRAVAKADGLTVVGAGP